jgi:ribosome maturation factor RimP
LAQKAADSNELELVHVEVASGGGRQVVQIFIDKEEGITHDDCVYVSQSVEKDLDAEDPIEGEYVLEVSSPGIERGLYKLADYVRFTGTKVRLTTAEPIDGQRNFRGIVEAVEGEDIVFEDVTSGEMKINFNTIRKANLEYDADRELKAGRRAEKKARRK